MTNLPTQYSCIIRRGGIRDRDDNVTVVPDVVNDDGNAYKWDDPTVLSLQYFILKDMPPTMPDTSNDANANEYKLIVEWYNCWVA